MLRVQPEAKNPATEDPGRALRAGACVRACACVFTPPSELGAQSRRRTGTGQIPEAKGPAHGAALLPAPPPPGCPWSPVLLLSSSR